MAIGQNVVLNMQNSTITGMLMSGSTQFGDIITNAGGVMNLQDTIISNNIADTLCSTIQSKGNSVLNLLGSTQITGNTAPKCGGAITLSENATLTINSEQVVLSGNIADKGSMLCINNGYNISHLTISNISPSSSGSVYLSTKMLAQTFSSTASYTTLQSLSSGVVFNSIPVALAFADSDFAGVASTGVKSYSLLPSKQIPKFKVKEIDYFNNSIADISNGPTFIELGNLSPVIYLNESTGTVNVLGETSKVLPIGADYFDDISLNTTGSNLTNFILNIYAYTGTMDFDNSTTWLTINVTITNCDGVNNTNYTDSNGMSKCYDFCPVNNSFRVGFGSIGIVFAVISGVVIFAMKVKKMGRRTGKKRQTNIKAFFN